MIEAHEISKEYGEQVLFRDATFNILPGERIGLVGRNGHGKSTLLRILCGEDEPDSGEIIVPKNYKMGYLRQRIDFTEKSVLEESCKGLPEAHHSEIWKCEKMLMGLGFTEEDFGKPPEVFSGGYQMRIELAKVLVSEPDMLLLDEPTNFLDIISIRWLEKELKAWRGELVIISHDRNFMDSIITNVIGIHRTKIRKMAGSTDKYYSHMAREEEVYEKRRINTEKKRKQVEGYISKFRVKARRAKSVQSSIKMLERMEKFDRLDNIRTLSFSFNQAAFRAPVVMDARGVCFSYDGGEKYLINNFNLTIERGEKICIAGANGKGKTTLAKILSGQLKPAKGEIKVNPQVAMAFYEQGNTAKLNAMMTVEEEILSAHPGKHRTEVKNICGAMMFSGDNSLKRISVLSGGERSRVLLAKTLLFPSNLLILDEPTHHLDIESCSALFEAVEEYEGAAVVVTHDEFFLHKVATKLIIFTGGRIMVFPGNYSEFLEQVGWESGDIVAKSARPGNNEAKCENQGVIGMNKKEGRRLRAKEAESRRKKLAPLEAKIKDLEKKIADSEGEYKTLTEEIIKASEEKDAPTITEASRKIKGLKPAIDGLYEELETVLGKYELAKKEFGEDEIE